ncbi:hypothetical protein CYL17_00650 [Thermobispora bispora]|jgi:hypothetical protein|nr:hypothetical protein [Actinomycetales bacterium]QSI46533.1 hypothetical protein CYL17_00650 [Thermobispora bispora]
MIIECRPKVTGMEPADLLEQARSRSADPANPLENLAAAIAIGRELGAEADPMLDLALREAREAGISWAAILERLAPAPRSVRRRLLARPFTRRRLANRRRKLETACSFCRRQPGPRVFMVYGEGGRICHHCVALASDIVADLAKRR